MTEINTAFAYQALDAALAHPSGFAMDTWAITDDPNKELITLADLMGPDCGTTACLAGWIVALAGYRMHEDGDVVDEGGTYLGHAYLMASDLLGITYEQGAELFCAGADKIEAAVQQMFGPRPEPAK